MTQLGGHNQIQPLEGSPPPNLTISKRSPVDLPRCLSFDRLSMFIDHQPFLAMKNRTPTMLKGILCCFFQRDQPLLFIWGELGNGGNASDSFLLPQLTSCSFRIQPFAERLRLKKSHPSQYPMNSHQQLVGDSYKPSFATWTTQLMDFFSMDCLLNQREETFVAASLMTWKMKAMRGWYYSWIVVWFNEKRYLDVHGS